MASDWYQARSGLSEHVMMDDFEREHGVTLDRKRTVEHVRRAFLFDVDSIEEIHEVAAIARQYRDRLPMAVASSGSAKIVVPCLKTTGLLELFDAVVTLDDVDRPKPEPDLFLEAARRLAASPERCLVLEDSPQGLEAAGRAGMMVFDVTNLSNRLKGE
jgi:beta-phosphoglucomutase-like phosphatase (HAD superfamily)